jgi:hypothetical protein
MKILAAVAVLLILLFLAISQIPTAQKPDPIDVAVAEMKRVMAETSLTGAVIHSCLPEPLSQPQIDYLLHRTEYETQNYVFALADSACQERSLRMCEKHYPSACLAVPGEINGRLP